MSEERIPLPHLLNRIADVVGQGKALSFAREFGGRRLSVPKRERMQDDHPIVQILGRAGADRLAQLYGGEVVQVPLGPVGTVAEARRRMAKALADGASINDAASASGLHHRTGQRMRKTIKDGRQGSLLSALDDEPGSA